MLKSGAKILTLVTKYDNILCIFINYNIDIWGIVLYFSSFLITLIYALINKNDVYKIASYILFSSL